MALDEAGKAVAEEKVVTAGKPDRIVLEADRTQITADGKDISFVTVSVLDKDGNPCPTASLSLKFKVTGEGIFKAACNGDATSLESFALPTMKLFSGKLVVLVQSTKKAGTMELSVTGSSVKGGKIKLQSSLSGK